MGSVGNRIFERHWRVTVQIFTPADQGVGELLDLQEQARSMFEGVSIAAGGEPINFFNVDAEHDDDEPHLLAGRVIASFRFQDRK